MNLEFILFFLNHPVESADDARLQQLYSSPGNLIMKLTHSLFFSILPCV